MWKMEPERLARLQAEVDEYELTGAGWTLRAGFDPDGGPFVTAVGPAQTVRMFINRRPLVEALANLEVALRIRQTDAGELRHRSER